MGLRTGVLLIIVLLIAAVLARVERLEAALRQRAEQTDNTLAAHVGQLEDRLDRRPV